MEVRATYGGFAFAALDYFLGGLMLRFYCTKNKNKSCMQAEKFLNTHGIHYQKIVEHEIRQNDILEMLKCSDSGFESLMKNIRISQHKHKQEKTEISMCQMVEIILEQPGLLKYPILLDGEKLQVGYNPDDIREFIPSGIRKIYRTHLLQSKESNHGLY